MKCRVLIMAIVLAATACGRTPGPVQQDTLPFPRIDVPGIISDPAGKAEYLVKNYWNAFFAVTGPTDSGRYNGVARMEVEEAVATYIAMMDGMDKDFCSNAVAGLFRQIEEKQAEDTTNHIFPAFTELIIKYLYDPNSPFRDEDLYLPFASGMAGSQYTPEDARPGYEFEKRMCAMNRYGTEAPDFSFTDSKGRRRNLHDIKADNILLFFSNPGCSACKDIIEALEDIRGIHSLISEGRLAVVDIYIDNELDKWREHIGDYPSDWTVGYDHKFIIREDVLYNVRAIPSLYMLDSQKRIVLKDAPVEKVEKYIMTNIK